MATWEGNRLRVCVCGWRWGRCQPPGCPARQGRHMLCLMTAVLGLAAQARVQTRGCYSGYSRRGRAKPLGCSPQLLEEPGPPAGTQDSWVLCLVDAGLPCIMAPVPPGAQGGSPGVEGSELSLGSPWSMHGHACLCTCTRVQGVGCQTRQGPQPPLLQGCSAPSMSTVLPVPIDFPAPSPWAPPPCPGLASMERHCQSVLAPCPAVALIHPGAGQPGWTGS